ncbi:MAG: hypothetical protein ABI383_15930 [Acidobacteriaceae bacterium]
MMYLNSAAALLGNVLLIFVLIYWGMAVLSDYFARGRVSRNITHLLGGIGLLGLALRCILSPGTAALLAFLAKTHLSTVLVGISTALLLTAIVAFGAITYWRPLRLWHERKLEEDLRRAKRELD